MMLQRRRPRPSGPSWSTTMSPTATATRTRSSTRTPWTPQRLWAPAGCRTLPPASRRLSSCSGAWTTWRSCRGSTRRARLRVPALRPGADLHGAQVLRLQNAGWPPSQVAVRRWSTGLWPRSCEPDTSSSAHACSHQTPRPASVRPRVLSCSSRTRAVPLSGTRAARRPGPSTDRTRWQPAESGVQLTVDALQAHPRPGAPSAASGVALCWQRRCQGQAAHLTLQLRRSQHQVCHTRSHSSLQCLLTSCLPAQDGGSCCSVQLLQAMGGAAWMPQQSPFGFPPDSERRARSAHPRDATGPSHPWPWGHCTRGDASQVCPAQTFQCLAPRLGPQRALE